MLPRRSRLSRASFPGSRAGASASTPHFSAVWGPARAGGSAGATGGAAAVVSKKVARRSVDRHLLKRRMLEVMRPFATPARYLVVYAKTGSHALPFRTLAEELQSLLSRINHSRMHP